MSKAGLMPSIKPLSGADINVDALEVDITFVN